jgi:dephospho-CoA kinase
MARVLLTGMSGAGKTTVLQELRGRGLFTVDTDDDGWELADRTWDEDRMGDLLAQHEHIVVSGTVENQGRFYNRFHEVVLLSAPLPVLLQRVSSRTNNPYGKTPEEQAEIAANAQWVEPRLRHGATLELDGQRPVAELADAVERLVAGPLRSASLSASHLSQQARAT